MDFLIATNNKSKYAEIARILNPLGINVLSLADLNIKADVVEDGETFAENAYKKAFHICKIANIPTIADDSGLCVDYLGGRPGVFTARYGGEDSTYIQKMNMLLYEMQGCPKDNRTARFVCSIACVFPNGDVITAEECCEGYIGTELKGDGGFGFDPIFYVGDKSYAEVSAEEKDKSSHRGKALNSFAGKISNYLKR